MTAAGDRLERPEPAAPARRPQALSMFSPLSAIVRGEVLTVPLTATVRETLEAMERHRLGSVVVADPARGVPLGIFTLRDLLRRVALPGAELEQPIACVMTSGLITLGPHATAHQAALVMARNHVRRVIVVDAAGALVGVVSQDDLFGLERAGVTEVGDRIRAARDVEALRDTAAGIRRLATGLLAQGVGAEMLTHAISTLNDLLTIRILELTADELDPPTVPMCWIALGSEGRLEQTFATDQDNGLVFECAPSDVDRVREALLPFARAVNARLAACGFPECKGGIMAGNPRWCLSLAEWKRTFAQWILEPHPEALLGAAIFFDLRPIHGHEALADGLREWVVETARGQPLFLRLLAEEALAWRPPLGTFRDFVCDGSKEFPHTIDLKANGARPFVDAARVLALANGVSHTNTAERLRAAAEAIRLDPDDAAAIVDGYHVVHLARLRNQCRGAVGDGNRVDPRALNDLERQVLKEAFRQARKLQHRLAVEHRL
ncbi:MAG TPA: DUF294 nucleotidyltransferase-like domain-containing protein [Anaeromyxobacteraceae bacterium]|nr:DUF294 nucleotidyltransferase-like domain-containing protein [Anaeromyxobacteraceae bacterium]